MQGPLRSIRVAVHWTLSEVARMRALPWAKQPGVPAGHAGPPGTTGVVAMNVAPAPHGTGSGPAATGRVLKVIVVPGAKPQNALVPTTGPPRGVMVAPLESKYSMAMSDRKSVV